MRPRNVVHVLGSGGQQARGIALTVMNLASSVDASRYRLSVIVLRENGTVAEALRGMGLNVRVIDWQGGRADIRGAMRFARVLREMHPDIVHLHAGGVSPRVVSKLAVGARVVVHYHSLEEEALTPRRLRRSALGADLVIANSRATASSVRGADPQVVYPGIKAPPPVARTGRAKVIVGVASRLAPVKGIVHLVDALALVARSHPQIEVVIAGDGPERPRIEAAARNAHLEDRVHFTGWVDDIAGLMREWDIYAQPSLAEGLGIAALEAMSTGLPVVASDVGGLREIVIDGETGYLVPVKDSRALGQRIAQLADDAALRERMGTAARSRVVDCFPFERESETIFAAYEDLFA